jgi:cathepsin E
VQQFDFEFKALTQLDSPLTTATGRSNLFWGIDQSIRYGTSTTILTKTAGIVDTGTTLTFIATGK